MKNIIITGAGGFIGCNLALALSEKYKIYAILHSQGDRIRLPEKNIIPIIGDLNDWEVIAKQIPEDIDIFYHLAWEGISSAEYKDMNIQQKNLATSMSCARLAKNVGCRRFVFVGSNQEYLMSKSKVDGTVARASVYGVCKLCARVLCQIILRDYMDYISVAFTNVFGVGDYSKRTANFFIRRLLQGQPLDLIQGNNQYDWTYIDDAVKGLIVAGEKGKNGKQYYIGSRHLRTFREILTEVRDILCPEAELHFGRYDDSTYTDYSQFDLDALYNDTGFESTVNFKDAILKTAEWVKLMD